MPAAATQPGAAGGQSGGKVPEAQAGYMELAGAQKDGECQKVDVQGGVSLDKGCCNFFEPQDESTDQFKCGECKYGNGQESGGNAGVDDQSKTPSDHPLQQLRAKPKGLGL